MAGPTANRLVAPRSESLSILFAGLAVGSGPCARQRSLDAELEVEQRPVGDVACEEKLGAQPNGEHRSLSQYHRDLEGGPDIESSCLHAVDLDGLASVAIDAVGEPEYVPVVAHEHRGQQRGPV